MSEETQCPGSQAQTGSMEMNNMGNMNNNNFGM